VDPAYHFADALGELVYQAGIFSFVPIPPILLSFGQWSQAGVVGAAILSALLLMVVALSNRQARYILLLVVAYLIAFAIAESITRLDLVNYRFIYPIVPLIVIGIFVIVDNVGRTLFVAEARPLGIFLKFGLKTLAALTIIAGANVVYQGFLPDDFRYGPKTIAAISRQLKAGDNVLVNRFGLQLSMFRPDVMITMVPFGDPCNGNYMEAYGIHLWTRDQFAETVSRLHIRYVVFFRGRDDSDPCDEYGPFMKSVFVGRDSLVESVQSLPDGRIITLRHVLTQKVHTGKTQQRDHAPPLPLSRSPR
jgi:hypothetical protein